MAKRTKALTRDLHERGLRKKLARRVARQIADPGPSAAGPAERLALAEQLRALAARVQGDVVAGHAEPSGPAAAAAPASEDDAIPPHRIARPRARRN